MGFLDFLGKKDASKVEEKESEKEPDSKDSKKVEPVGKYNEACSLCGKGGTDVKWAGQFWHKKCYRGAKKMAKRMV